MRRVLSLPALRADHLCTGRAAKLPHHAEIPAVNRAAGIFLQA